MVPCLLCGIAPPLPPLAPVLLALPGLELADIAPPPLAPPADSPEVSDAGPCTSDSDSESGSTADLKSTGGEEAEAEGVEEEAEAEGLQTQVAQLTQDYDAMAEKVGEMQDAMMSTEEWAKDVEEENMDLKKQNVALKDENARLKRRCAELGNGSDLGEAMSGHMDD